MNRTPMPSLPPPPPFWLLVVALSVVGILGFLAGVVTGLGLR